MAVYRPNMAWLKEQVASLWTQEGVCVRLHVRDDCPENPVGEAWFDEHFAGHAYSYVVNESNLCPCAAFARLAGEAEEPYLAFCDQDDIWASDKLRCLYEKLQEPGVTLAYSAWTSSMATAGIKQTTSTRFGSRTSFLKARASRPKFSSRTASTAE